jgi:hypothetical protein
MFASAGFGRLFGQKNFSELAEKTSLFLDEGHFDRGKGKGFAMLS